MSEIALDVDAMKRIGDGTPLELLTRIAELQPIRASELEMTSAAWDQLATIRTRGVFARVDQSTSVSAELRDLGLVTASGGLSPQGESLLRVRSSAKLLFGASSDSGGNHTTFNSWYLGSEALAAAQRVEVNGSIMVTIHKTTLSASLGLLTSWLRVGPAWSIGHGDEADEHGAALIERRIQARPGHEPAVPDGASWLTRRAWEAGEWTRYAVVSPALSKKCEQIRTGDVGWFRPEHASTGRVRLAPLDTLQLMYNVVELFQDSVHLLR